MKRWTEAGALRATERHFIKIDDLLMTIALLWGDENQYVVNLVEDLRHTCSTARAEAKACIEELRVERANAAADEAERAAG